jgi:hypothetical protein
LPTAATALKHFGFIAGAAILYASPQNDLTAFTTCDFAVICRLCPLDQIRTAGIERVSDFVKQFFVEQATRITFIEPANLVRRDAG